MKKKRLIATCQSLEKFLPPKKRIAENNDSGQLQSAGDALPTSSSISLRSLSLQLQRRSSSLASLRKFSLKIIKKHVTE